MNLVAILALLVLALLLAALVRAGRVVCAGRAVWGSLPTVWGGGRKEEALASQNVVIDTLNLTHWLKTDGGPITAATVVAAIEASAPVLRRRYSGRIVYVTKNRESLASKESAERLRELFLETAQRCNVFIHMVERLPDPYPTTVSRPHQLHAALGRDDFYLIMLAAKYRCAVLSHDRFRDLVDMKIGNLDRFHVYSFIPGKPYPERDFVNPSAAEFARLRRPTTLGFAEALPSLRASPPLCG